MCVVLRDNVFYSDGHYLVCYFEGQYLVCVILNASVCYFKGQAVLFWGFMSCWSLVWLVMGCIQSIRCKPKSFRDSIMVLEVNSSIDSNPTSIDESSSVVLRYRTPHFRASARVVVPPVVGKESWTVGWIQACNHMEFYNKYGSKGMWVRKYYI